MRRFESDVMQQMRRRGDGVKDCPVLAACSGGGDSVALLACLVALKESLNIEITAAHVNHELRSESTEEAEFVKALCKNFGVPLRSCSINVGNHATRTGLSIEMAARELRWSWLKKEAALIAAPLVATGHTIEDHTETVFVRLARGSGLGCLTGLPAVQPPRWSPLIECRREDLRRYLRRSGLEWREDGSNDAGFTPRNRWRKHLADFRLEAPKIDDHLLETHRQAAELLKIRDSIVSSWRGDKWGITEDGHLWLAVNWTPVDLEWVLEAAFRELGDQREPGLLRGLAAWISKVLGRRIKRTWRWGNWSLCPHPKGAELKPTRQTTSKKV
ncbi:MAG: tRNA lysidine(34) synthetase TilS [Holophagales bacterium]|nr:tRNA lysidine(34) synthetase TilS [Holophagales bacterium]